jgi:hypothetical protein
MGNKSRELRGHTSSSVAYYEIAYEQGKTKGTKRSSWVIRNSISSENHFTSHDLCDENHGRQVEIRVQVLLASVEDTRW